MPEPPYAQKRTPRCKTALKKIKYKNIQDQLPPMFKSSLAVCIPHNSRLYCVILDLSFRPHVNGKYISLVNDTTIKTEPHKSMVWLVSTLKQLIELMADNYDL